MTEETTENEQYMRLALDLARRGIGSVEPNPAVGCVIVQDNAIIGKGWHERFGGPHAEINALSDCWKHGYNPAGSTIYITLEPCKHFGKTPPCTEAIVMAGIKKVVFATNDPFAVSGGGSELLKHAGIEIVSGVCSKEARELNAAFFKHGQTGMPWVVLKWAQSIDGKLAWKNPAAEGNWISNEQSRLDVHQLRKRSQGILTGVNTVICDNPQFTVRINNHKIERPPARIVMDSNLRIAGDCVILEDRSAPTIIVTTDESASKQPKKIEKLRQAGAEVLTVPAVNHKCDLTASLKIFGSRGIQRILVEAGPTLITEFLRQNLADEVRIYIAPFILGNDGTADLSVHMSALLNNRKLSNLSVERFGTDTCISATL